MIKGAVKVAAASSRFPHKIAARCRFNLQVFSATPRRVTRTKEESIGQNEVEARIDRFWIGLGVGARASSHSYDAAYCGVSGLRCLRAEGFHSTTRPRISKTIPIHTLQVIPKPPVLFARVYCSKRAAVSALNSASVSSRKKIRRKVRGPMSSGGDISRKPV